MEVGTKYRSYNEAKKNSATSNRPESCGPAHSHFLFGERRKLDRLPPLQTLGRLPRAEIRALGQDEAFLEHNQGESPNHGFLFAEHSDQRPRFEVAHRIPIRSQG